MADDIDIMHAERIAVLETKVDGIQNSVNKILEKQQEIHNMVQQSKGASRVFMWAGMFFGAGTAAALYAKWSLFLSWMGK